MTPAFFRRRAPDDFFDMDWVGPQIFRGHAYSEKGLFSLDRSCGTADITDKEGFIDGGDRHEVFAHLRFLGYGRPLDWLQIVCLDGQQSQVIFIIAGHDPAPADAARRQVGRLSVRLPTLR